jgi:hypothetical protein
VARHESSKGVGFGLIHDHALRKASERATQIEKRLPATRSPARGYLNKSAV